MFKKKKRVSKDLWLSYSLFNLEVSPALAASEQERERETVSKMSFFCWASKVIIWIANNRNFFWNQMKWKIMKKKKKKKKKYLYSRLLTFPI